MTSPVPTIGHRRCLDEALRILMEKSAPAVAVVDSGGRLVGLVTSETLGEMMMLQQAMPSSASKAEIPASTSATWRTMPTHSPVFACGSVVRANSVPRRMMRHVSPSAAAPARAGPAPPSTT